MKRFAMAALAAATFMTPMIGSEAFAQRGDRDRHDRYDRDDRRDDRRDRRDYRDDRRDYNRGYRDGRRDDRRADRWDNRRHNGYTYQGRWYYGPPPAHWRDQARYEYRQWRRGDRLPQYYRSHYRAVDYRYHRLRAPPRGYHYVRDDRGDYLLVGIATGVILGVILAGQ